MEEEEVKCPSGLKGQVRRLKVEDEKLLNNAKLARSGKLIQELCKKCWVATDDPGPYDLGAGEQPPWSKMLQGDLFWIFLTIRRITYGDEYSVTLPCASCKHRIHEDIDLGELEAQELAKEAFESFKSGEPMETEFNGKRITHRQLTSADDKAISNLEELHDLPQKYGMLVMRMVEVEGLEKRGPGGISGKAGLMQKVKFITALDAGEADELLEHLEQWDCGVDTDVDIVCDNCGYVEEVPLPLEKSFFQRKRKNKKKMKMRREMLDEQNVETGEIDT